VRRADSFYSIRTVDLGMELRLGILGPLSLTKKYRTRCESDSRDYCEANPN